METRIAVCAVADLLPGSAQVVHTDIGHVSVYNIDGRFHAIDDLCPHMRESLGQGHIDGACVTCPAHGWRFDVRSGKSPDFEGIEVATYPVEVADGTIWLILTGTGDDGWMDWDGATDPDDIEKELFD
ncbi:MAG: Rieske 2Fe-2S domain-containing protein [Euryarchaeota archaeon]|nr:Rieske 2Fe-2S domain-containing protein [Euryarchaeota archaeon]